MKPTFGDVKRNIINVKLLTWNASEQVFSIKASELRKNGIEDVKTLKDRYSTYIIENPKTKKRVTYTCDVTQDFLRINGIIKTWIYFPKSKEANIKESRLYVEHD